MAAPTNLRATGDRIELLLDKLEQVADPPSFALAEELLRLVSDLYGAGLAAIVAMAGEIFPQLLDAFVEDELVASLLVVQGLHPQPLLVRVEDALARVRPLLASHGGDVELLGVDAESGVVELRLLGSCDGCPSSTLTLKMAVEAAITEAAPEIVRVFVDETPKESPSVPVALRSKQRYSECPAEVAHA